MKNTHVLERAYDITRDWLRRAGLDVDRVKRELMHYTRRKCDEQSPSARLSNGDGSFTTVPTSSTVRWLGIFFDRKLLFNRHVQTLAARAENTVQGLTMLANTVRGLHQMHMRHLYKACVIPVMFY
ncbi:uncharacterized protein SCHCODRAFT_02485960, partial [Schizophyllum commune H4-8]|uniref:uncharacterized protein n=1 Tax=Schizophyllum commune (strain H4-8 / FGSC 9210) TaxID=578458 RepID=UPI00215E2A1E